MLCVIRYLLHHLYHFTVALAGLTLLLSITAMADLSPHLAELTLFLVLYVVVKRAGFHNFSASWTYSA